jgi:autotransporter-associated beta strand protein
MLMVQAHAQITVGGGGANTTDSTSYSGAQSLTKIGSNIVTLSGDNSYTGLTTVDQGQLVLGAGSGDYRHNASDFAINNASILSFGGVRFDLNNGTTGTVRTITFDAGGGNTFDTGTGVNLVDWRGNTYRSTGGMKNFMTGSSGLNINRGVTATLDVARGTDTTSDLLVSTYFSNAGGITKTGNGIATLTGTNTYSGATTISAGTLQVGNGGTTGSLGSGNVTNNATLAINRNNAYTLANDISGTGSLTQAGTGTTTLSGNNTYTGGTTINAGALNLGGGSSTGGNFTIGNGATLQATASSFWFNGTPRFSFTANGGGTIDTSSGGNFIMGGNSTYTSAGGAQNLIKGSSGINLNLGGVTATLDVARGTDATSDLLVSTYLWNAGGITKTGNGILTFSEINSFSGGLTVNAGIVNVSAPTSWTDSASGSGSSNNAIVVNNGATLRYTTERGAGYHSANATINGGTVTFDADDMNFAVGKTLTFDSQAGTINGTGQWRRRDAGNSIVVTAAASGSLISVANLNLFDASPEFNVADGVQSADLTVSSSITGGADLRKTGAGMMVLSGNNSYSGTTTISAGALQIGNGGTNGTLGTGAVTNNASLVFNRANALAVANVISGTGSVAQNGAGVTTLAASNAYTGGTTVNAGTLALGANNRLADGGAVTVNGGNFNLGGFSETVGAVTVAGGSITNGTLTGSSYDMRSGTVSAVLAGNGALTKTTAGTATLTGANTYTGGTTVNAGRLATTGHERLADTGAVTVNSGGTLAVGGNETISSIAGNGSVVLSGRLTSGASSSTFGGAMSGIGGLTKNGAGTFTLSGASTYTGDTILSGGTLVLNSANALWTGGVLSMDAGTTLTVNQRTFIGALDQGGGTIDGPGQLVATLTLTESGALNAVLADGPDFAAGILKRTAGTTTIGAANTFTGAINVQGGTLQLAAGGSFDAASSLALSSGATMDLNNKAQTFSAVQGTGGTVALGSGSLTVSNAADNSFGGAITGTGGVTKNGAGMMELTGANTYTGETLVNAGTLILNGSSSSTSTTTVASGATLSGSGIIGGNTIISGTHTPGNSPGIQTFQNDLSYTVGSSIVWELVDNTISGRGTDYDGVDVSGDLMFTGSTTITLDFALLGSMVDWTSEFWNNDHTGTEGWKIFDVAGEITGFENLTLAGSMTDAGGTSLTDERSGASFNLFEGADGVYLNYAAVPEPSVALLGGLGLLALLVRRR